MIETMADNRDTSRGQGARCDRQVDVDEKEPQIAHGERAAAVRDEKPTALPTRCTSGSSDPFW